MDDHNITDVQHPHPFSLLIWVTSQLCLKMIGTNYVESGRRLLRIYQYIPLFSSIIYSLNYFPDIFSILLFKSCYLEATDIFLHFSH